MTGILLIDKPRDWTSHDVVAKLRGLYRERRIGHAGTLDPLATGLLLVFIGRATRGVEFAQSREKSYIVQLKLGLSTDTQDITGRVLARSERPVSREALEAVLPRFLGEISQLPPMYSAVRVQGQRLYKLARQGREVERAARLIQVDRISILAQREDGFDLEVACSKGTYIRSLCHDIGEALGSGGAMAALRRTRVGDFSLKDAHTLEEIEAVEDRGQFLQPLDSLFSLYPALRLDADREKKLKHGQNPEISSAEPGLCRVYSQTGEFLALGEVVKGKGLLLRAKKSFFAPNP